MSILRVQNISSGYGNKQVLHNISFDVAEQEIVLLIGANGCGKSTALKTIYGILGPWNDGKIYFENEDITGLNSSRLIKKGLLYMPQKDGNFEGLTVQENLEISGLTLGRRKLLYERISEVYDIFPTLRDLRNRTPLKISGGEKKIMEFGMALMHRPKMILLDEPIAGLSPGNVSVVMETVVKLNKESAISFLIVEHGIKESYGVAQRIIAMKNGKVSNSYNVDADFVLDSLKPVFV